MFDLIANVLSFFYSVVNSYAGAISLLTLAVMVVVLPLTLKGTRSMIELQRHQPELKAIQTKYKDDRQKMNEEVMAFYQANNINPVGGCLPLFVQLPVFLVLFRVIRGLTRRESDLGAYTGTVAGRFRGGTDTITGFDFEMRNFNPSYLDPASEMAKDLSGTNKMSSWGIDLAKSASQEIGEGFTTALPYVLMILAVFATGYYQQRQIQGRNTGSQINPQQQMIMKVMPFVLPIISFGLPAAMLVYFIVSNLFRIVQQAYITRAMYSGDNAAPAKNVVDAAATKTKSKPATKAAKKPQVKAGGSPKKSSSTSTAATNGSTKRGRTKAGERQRKKPKETKTTPRSESGRTTPAGTVTPRGRKRKRK